MQTKSHVHTCESVVKDVILFQYSPSRVKYTNAPFFTVVDLVSSQGRIGVCLDPHTSQGIAVYIILNKKTLPRVVDKNTSILPTENLISLDDWIAARSEGIRKISNEFLYILQCLQTDTLYCTNYMHAYHKTHTVHT